MFAVKVVFPRLTLPLIGIGWLYRRNSTGSLGNAQIESLFNDQFLIELIGMALCNYCTEPAVKHVVSGFGDNAKKKDLCYMHAHKEGILALPISELTSIAEKLGSPINGIAFVLECAIRSDNSNGTAMQKYVTSSAAERFKESADKILQKWRIVEVAEIAVILNELSVYGVWNSTESDGE